MATEHNLLDFNVDELVEFLTSPQRQQTQDNGLLLLAEAANEYNGGAPNGGHFDARPAQPAKPAPVHVTTDTMAATPARSPGSPGHQYNHDAGRTAPVYSLQ